MKEWSYNSALGCYEVDAGMECDADGANGQTGGIPCYAPAGMKSLDDLRNAGYPGNWYGILTDTGEKTGKPVRQDDSQPAPGAYISTTTYQFTKYPDGRVIPIWDVNRYLDAAAVKFIVVPDRFRRGVPGIVMGCYCEAWKGSQMVAGIVGDIGPDFGEASLAMCKEFDSKASPRGTNIDGITYHIYPGREVAGYPLLRRG